MGRNQSKLSKSLPEKPLCSTANDLTEILADHNINSDTKSEHAILRKEGLKKIKDILNKCLLGNEFNAVHNSLCAPKLDTSESSGLFDFIEVGKRPSTPIQQEECDVEKYINDKTFVKLVEGDEVQETATSDSRDFSDYIEIGTSYRSSTPLPQEEYDSEKYTNDKTYNNFVEGIHTEIELVEMSLGKFIKSKTSSGSFPSKSTSSGAFSSNKNIMISEVSNDNSYYIEKIPLFKWFKDWTLINFAKDSPTTHIYTPIQLNKIIFKYNIYSGIRNFGYLRCLLLREDQITIEACVSLYDVSYVIKHQVECQFKKYVQKDIVCNYIAFGLCPNNYEIMNVAPSDRNVVVVNFAPRFETNVMSEQNAVQLLQNGRPSFNYIHFPNGHTDHNSNDSYFSVIFLRQEIEKCVYDRVRDMTKTNIILKFVGVATKD